MAMTLEDLQHAIERSSRDDWSRLDYPALPEFSLYGEKDGRFRLGVRTHHTLLTLRQNLDVQLAYGMDEDDDGSGEDRGRVRSFAWAADFMHPYPSMVRVHALYRNSVVDQVRVLSFDGAWLPVPTHLAGGDEVFTGKSLHVSRLLHSIDYQADSEEAERLMRQSGLRVID